MATTDTPFDKGVRGQNFWGSVVFARFFFPFARMSFPISPPILQVL